MNNPKSYSLLEVFNFVNIGFVFEFYSSKESSFIIKELSAKTIKNIIHTNNLEIDPTFTNAVLVKEYEGDKPRYSFKLAQQNFHTAIPIVKNVLEWISLTSECANDNRMKVNLSFDTKHLNTLESISLMDTAKLILKFDENYVYNRFPQQKNSPYCISIKTLSRINENIYSSSIIKNKNSIIRIPKNDYNGINFKDYNLGILEFNYIGGVNYAEKEKEIIEILEFYVLKTFQSLNEQYYTREEVDELNELAENYITHQDAFHTVENFNKQYPNISLSVDLNTSIQKIKTFWPYIKKELFELVVNDSFLKGEFNYDTDIAKCQIRNATLVGPSIVNLDLINCRLNGLIENCHLNHCIIENSRIYSSKVITENKITNSYIKNGVIDSNNVIDRCIVDNLNEMINCVIKKSIVKFAGIGSLAKLDESSTIIELKTYSPSTKMGVEIEEIRDYKWISDMRKSKDLGFQNIYKKPKLIINND
jgi:hypothetical protein